MNTYKLLVADIDGTVVDHGSDGSEVGLRHPAKQAMDTARSQGKAITFATGRNYLWAKPVIEAFQIVTPVIVNSGSRLVDPMNDQVLWEKRLETALGKSVYDFIQHSGMSTNFSIGLGYLEEVPFEKATQKAINDLIYLDLIGIAKEEDIERIVTYVKRFDNAHVTVLPSPQVPGNKNIVVTNSEGTKYNALRELQKLLGVIQAETIAIGDGENDLPLFEASGLKAAVDNADEKLKQAADLLVSSVNEHGIVEVIETQLIKRS